MEILVTSKEKYEVVLDGKITNYHNRKGFSCSVHSVAELQKSSYQSFAYK